jgi:hypothetical protein
MIGLGYAALAAPQLILSYRGRRSRWAQALLLLGSLLLLYGFWRQLGGVEALRNPHVYLGLVLGGVLPFAFAWFVHRAWRSQEGERASETLSDDG